MGRNKLRDGILPDRHDQKRFPNAFAAMIRAMYRAWLLEAEELESGKTTTPRRFVEQSDFAEIYADAIDRYRGHARKPASNAETPEQKVKQISDMLEGIGTQNKDLEYYKLKATCDFLGISDAAFITVAKLISIERRAENPIQAQKAQIEFIQAMRNLLETAEGIILEEGGKQFSYVDNVSLDGTGEKRREIWVADVGVLKLLCRSYRKDSMQTLGEILKKA